MLGCTLTGASSSSLSRGGTGPPYELAEGLEQLRFLENGVPIHVVETDTPLIGVDVPADLETGQTDFGGLIRVFS